MPKNREQQRQYEAAYRQRHRAEINARNRERYETALPGPKPISEERKAYLREYRKKNRKRLVAKRQEHVKTKGEQIKAQQAEYRKQRAKERSARQQAYYRKNRAARLAYNRQYAVKAKDRLRQRRHERYASGPAYRLRLDLRNRLNAAVRNGCRAGSAVPGALIHAAQATHLSTPRSPAHRTERAGPWHEQRARLRCGLAAAA